MPGYHFRYSFHGVGQGLFASGAVSHRQSRKAFHWVYDCGTSSGRRYIGRLVKLQAWRGGPLDSWLNLLVISHFDSDHINGLVGLLSECCVRTLLLPYLSLPARLLIAFEEGIGPSDDRIGFFVNPTAFLAAAFPERVGEIVYVPPSGEVGPMQASASNPLPLDDNGILPPLHVEAEAAAPDDVQPPSSIPNAPQVKLLKPGAAMSLAALWEFVPYNDDPQKAIPADFVSAVALLKQRLLQASDASDRKAALAELKARYTLLFGSTPERRNTISLFMYAGPVVVDGPCLWQHCHKPPNGCAGYFWPYYHMNVESRGRSGCLYTGDGYLDTPARLDRLAAYLAGRIGNVAVLQVMHHGSSRNWCANVPSRLSPVFSLFSSDPGRGNGDGHPDAEVLRSFVQYGISEANLEQTSCFCGRL